MAHVDNGESLTKHAKYNYLTPGFLGDATRGRLHRLPACLPESRTFRGLILSGAMLP